MLTDPVELTIPEELAAADLPLSGTPDDDDNREDEQTLENGAPVGPVDEHTEMPEEFSTGEGDARESDGANEDATDGRTPNR